MIEHVMTEGPQARLGESWEHGSVVLSWDDVRRGAFDVRDGHNVVFHEFAHQLDQADRRGAWSTVAPDAFDVLGVGARPRSRVRNASRRP